MKANERSSFLFIKPRKKSRDSILIRDEFGARLPLFLRVVNTRFQIRGWQTGSEPVNRKRVETVILFFSLFRCSFFLASFLALSRVRTFESTRGVCPRKVHSFSRLLPREIDSCGGTRDEL